MFWRQADQRLRRAKVFCSQTKHGAAVVEKLWFRFHAFEFSISKLRGNLTMQAMFWNRSIDLGVGEGAESRIRSAASFRRIVFSVFHRLPDFQATERCSRD